MWIKTLHFVETYINFKYIINVIRALFKSILKCGSFSHLFILFSLLKTALDWKQVSIHENMCNNSPHTHSYVLHLWTHTETWGCCLLWICLIFPPSEHPGRFSGRKAESAEMTEPASKTCLEQLRRVGKGYRPSTPPTSKTIANASLMGLQQCLNELNARLDCHSNYLLGNKSVWRADTADRSVILTDQWHMTLIPIGNFLTELHKQTLSAWAVFEYILDWKMHIFPPPQLTGNILRTLVKQFKKKYILVKTNTSFYNILYSKKVASCLLFCGRKKIYNPKLIKLLL